MALLYKGNDCTVQSVKPQQCRDFPNLWNFSGFDKTRHAISRLIGEEEYQCRIAQIKLTGSTSTALIGDNVLPASCRQD